MIRAALTPAESEIVSRYLRGLPVNVEYIGLIADALGIVGGFRQVAIAHDAIIVAPNGFAEQKPQAPPQTESDSFWEM